MTLALALAITAGTEFDDTASAGGGAPGPLSGTVDYGDGTGTQVLAVGASGSLALAHTYAFPGSYQVTVRVTDAAGTVGQGMLTVVVSAGASGFGTGPDAFVTTLYRDGLARLPRADELHFWSGLLAVKIRPKAVARSIYKSSEHKTLVGRGSLSTLPFRLGYGEALRAASQAGGLGAGHTARIVPKLRAKGHLRPR